MVKNFWKMKDFSLFTVPYLYIDHNSYLADDLFAQRSIKMKIRGEMVRDDSPYCIIFCNVHKKDIQKFEEALGKLENKMLLFGYTDYPEVCSEVAGLVDKARKAG